MVTPFRLGGTRASSTSDTEEHSARVLQSRGHAVHDRGLIERFNRGDVGAFAELQSFYRPRMIAAAYGFLRNRADAEDVAQETFVRAYRSLAKFRGDASLATWLYGITANLSRNRYWYHVRRGRNTNVSFDQPLGEENGLRLSDLVADTAVDPGRALDLDDYARVVQMCIGQLESRSRDVLDLRNSKFQSYDEIAGRLGVNVGTVKSRLSRARQKLRTLIDQAANAGGVSSPATACAMVATGPKRVAA